MSAALAIATYVVANLPGWIQAGMDVYGLWTKTQALIDENKGPGNDDWNALDEQAKALQAIVRDKSTD